MYSQEEYMEIVDGLAEALRDMEDGSRICTEQLLEGCGYEPEEFDLRDLLEIHAAVMEAAADRHITLDLSAYDGQVTGLMHRMEYVVLNRRAKIRCPYCGSRNVCRILYGMPVFDEELQKALDEGKIVLGGCAIMTADLDDGRSVRIDPERYCNDCGKEFGRPPYLVNLKENRAEDYRKIVRKLEFSVGGYLYGTKTVSFTRTENGAEAVTESMPYRPADKKHRHLSRKKWQKLLNALYRDCFLNEWKKRYVDLNTLDGEQWSLKITLEGNRHRNYHGSNDHPVYWKEVLRLFRPYLRATEKM